MFVHNFNLTIAASGTLEAGVKYTYLRTLVWGEVLRQFDLLSADLEGTENPNIDYIIRGQTDKKLTSMLVIRNFLSFELADIF